MIIEHVHGQEREETGLRGIQSLITSGRMLEPKTLHVDAMQRAVEIDETRYECTVEDARRLENALNSRYLPRNLQDKGIVIGIKENVAANTGFDIHFMIKRAGIPVEFKEHLSQEALDLLTDSTKCELLQPDIHLRLAPPYLLIRRRRPDMGEDKVPGLADVNYLQITAVQFQHVLNSPLIRRNAIEGGRSGRTEEEGPADVIGLRVARNPSDPRQLWLVFVTSDGRASQGRAFTHHNVAELQHEGFFQSHFEVRLSMDHKVLNVLDTTNQEQENMTVDALSSDEDLAKAGQMLTKALRPPSRTKPVQFQRLEPEAAVERARGNGPSAMEPSFKRTETLMAASDLTRAVGDESIASLFREYDPVLINREIFKRLGAHCEVEVQKARFSLPYVFDDRLFEIVNFCEGEVESLMELRGEDFCGFYLSHINEEKQVLVYGCIGAYIEWGPDKCVLKHSSGEETEDYPTSGLLGLAKDQNEELVFIVQRAFKEWIKPRESKYSDLFIHFALVGDIAAAPENYSLIWPEKPE
jgi:hypothetical protein